MSKRKSLSGTSSRGISEISISPLSFSASKQHSNFDAHFTMIKCNICQVELTKRDKLKHENENICKTLIESSLELKIDEYSEASSKENLFQCPFVLERHIVVVPRSYAMNISKEKLKHVEDLPPHDNLVLLSSELMAHCGISSGSHVSARYLDHTNRPKQFYLVATAYDSLKTALSVAFIKESSCSKPLFTKDGSPCSAIRLNLAISTINLKTVNFQIKYKFKDPFTYLKDSVTIKRKLVHKVINSNEEEIIVEINENTAYQLAVISLEPTSTSVETLQMESLSLSDNSNRLSANSVHIVSDNTTIIFSSDSDPLKNDQPFMGYGSQMGLLERLIINKSGTKSLPRTILLTGPSGTGKSHAMKHIFARTCQNMNVIKLDSSTMLAKSFEYEKLRTAFRNLVALQPSVLFLDNLEDVSSGQKTTEDKRFVCWLKTILDEFQEKCNNTNPVIIIGATSRPELLDTSLRRPGRFDVEVEFPIPSPDDRKLILFQVLKLVDSSSTLEKAQIDELAELAHGFTGADLKHLCKMALLFESDQGGHLDCRQLTFSKLAAALRRIKPSIMREITLERPNVRWSDIGGMHSLRHILQETVVWPVKHPEAFIRLGIEPPRGILMYGPPGCCKTMIGKALASESGLNFFSIKGPELFSKWVGESERAIREMFRKARAASPSILFFDEIDALAAERGQNQSAVGDRVLAQLLTEIDGVEKLSQVAIIAATNRPDIVDKALMRPGRLDSMVYVPLPDHTTRKEIFQIQTKRMRLPELTELESAQLIDHLADKSEGYTGAEVIAVCQRAGLLALTENLQADSVSKEHFEGAFGRVKPRIGAKMIAFFDDFASRCEEMKNK